MRKEKISEVLGYMDEQLVEEAGDFTGVEKVKKTRHTLIASTSADITGFVLSALAVRLLLN